MGKGMEEKVGGNGLGGVVVGELHAVFLAKSNICSIFSPPVSIY